MIERELGELGLSIPTSSAFEVLMESESSDVVYDSIWINLRTLVRNLVSSISNKEAVLEPDAIAYELVSEVDLITDIISNIPYLSNADVVVYNNTYAGLEKRLPRAKLKAPSTEKQIDDHMLETNILANFTSIFDDPNSKVSYRQGDYTLEGGDDTSLILTHCPVDLMSVYNFNTLRLLESHTGSVKKRSMWNTKLTGGKKNARLPFNLFTLQVFGDNSVHFYGYSYKYKQLVLSIASDKDWNSTTSKDKIVKDIESSLPEDAPFLNLFKELLNGKLYF